MARAAFGRRRWRVRAGAFARVAAAHRCNTSKGERWLTKAGYSQEVIDETVKQNDKSQTDGRAALAVPADMGVVGLFFTGRIPRQPPGSAPAPA